MNIGNIVTCITGFACSITIIGNSLAAPLYSDPAGIASLISRTHIAHPPVPDIPTDSIEALQAFLQRLDVYSSYLTPQEFSQDTRITGVNQSGLGGLVTHTPEDGLILVPFREGPAYQSGLHNPVQLLEIQGDEVTKLTIADIQAQVAASNSIQVKAKDLVTGKRVATDIAIEPFQVPSVETLRIGNQPVVRIHVFEERRTLEVLRHALQKATMPNRPLVIDLRYATGGSLFEALDSISLVFPEQDTIASVEYSDGKSVTFRGRDDQRISPGPVYLLIGSNTVSAAEVFARALHYYGYAMLVGKPTFGKCTTQRLIGLSKGDGLKLTAGRILDPAGMNCAGRGIEPDIVQPGNIHDTEALLHLIEQHNQNHRLICHAKTYSDIRLLRQEAEKLGWMENNNRLKPISLMMSGNDLRLCLAPPQSLNTAAAVQQAENQRARVELKLLPLFKAAQYLRSPQSPTVGQHAGGPVSKQQEPAKLSSKPKDSVSAGGEPVVKKPPAVKPAPMASIRAQQNYNIRVGPFANSTLLLRAQGEILDQYSTRIRQLRLHVAPGVKIAKDETTIYHLEIGYFANNAEASEFCEQLRLKSIKKLECVVHTDVSGP